MQLHEFDKNSADRQRIVNAAHEWMRLLDKVFFIV